jgi:ribosomal protein L7/L12
MNTELISFIRNILQLGTLAEVHRAAAIVLLAQVDELDKRYIQGECKPGMVNGYRLTPISYKEIQDLILENRKIPAIKELRVVTGWGLLEAKNAVENPKNFKQPVPIRRPDNQWLNG